jgi:hypothetical protein
VLYHLDTVLFIEVLEIHKFSVSLLLQSPKQFLLLACQLMSISLCKLLV